MSPYSMQLPVILKYLPNGMLCSSFVILIQCELCLNKWVAKWKLNENHRQFWDGQRFQYLCCKTLTICKPFSYSILKTFGVLADYDIHCSAISSANCFINKSGWNIKSHDADIVFCQNDIWNCSIPCQYADVVLNHQIVHIIILLKCIIITYAVILLWRTCAGWYIIA